MSLLLLIFTAFFHPLHMSLTEAKFNRAEKRLELTQKIFIDDLEDAMKAKGYAIKDLIKDHRQSKTDSLVGVFGKSHLSVALNGKPQNLVYLGCELEEDALWLYYEVPNVKKLKSFALGNTLFLDRFSNQENFVNLILEEETIPFRLNGSTTLAQYEPAK